MTLQIVQLDGYGRQLSKEKASSQTKSSSSSLQQNTRRNKSIKIAANSKWFQYQDPEELHMIQNLSQLTNMIASFYYKRTRMSLQLLKGMKIYENKQEEYKDILLQQEQRLLEWIQLDKLNVVLEQKKQPKNFLEIKDNFFYYIISKQIRIYQYEIAKACLLHNTLVCLPTGLGKTFISLNVILNFHFWFPEQQIYFLAPTKPLVKQQYDCIEKVSQIDLMKIVLLNGEVKQDDWQLQYKYKKIFFMTPQTLENDLKIGLPDISKISLIIFDEAHRSNGAYSYVNVAKTIMNQNQKCWFVALSASPGKNIKEVQQLVKNLYISHIEVRSNKQEDIRKYQKKTVVAEIVVSSSEELEAIQQTYQTYVEKIFSYLGEKSTQASQWNFIKRKMHKINYKTLQKLHKMGSWFMSNDQQQILKLLYKLVYMKNYLDYQSFGAFYQSVIEVNDTIQEIIRDNELQEELVTIEPVIKLLQREFLELKKEHPKMMKLWEVIQNFQDNAEKIQRNSNSKTIIFTQNCESALQIKSYLAQGGIIKAQIFVGQWFQGDIEQIDPNVKRKDSNGLQMNQKIQNEILRDFKNNKYNILISTCVGEEGLDIGEVDLIICFDSGLSPIRITQRFGRTGRKRDGCVCLILTNQEFLKFKRTEKKMEKIFNKLSLQPIKDIKFFQNGSILGHCSKKELDMKILKQILKYFYGLDE